MLVNMGHFIDRGPIWSGEFMIPVKYTLPVIAAKIIRLIPK